MTRAEQRKALQQEHAAKQMQREMVEAYLATDEADTEAAWARFHDELACWDRADERVMLYGDWVLAYV